MVTRSHMQVGRFDSIKWLIVLALVVAGVVANAVYTDQSLLYRVLGLLLIALSAAFIAAQTVKGSAFIVMLKEARNEIRKVVWPNRQETLQTTMIVVVVVLIMALLLWGLDSLLSWIVSLFIG